MDYIKIIEFLERIPNEIFIILAFIVFLYREPIGRDIIPKIADIIRYRLTGQQPPNNDERTRDEITDDRDFRNAERDLICVTSELSLSKFGITDRTVYDCGTQLFISDPDEFKRVIAIILAYHRRTHKKIIISLADVVRINLHAKTVIKTMVRNIIRDNNVMVGFIFPVDIDNEELQDLYLYTNEQVRLSSSSSIEIFRDRRNGV